MRWLALLVGAIVALVGLAGTVSPGFLVGLFRNSVTPPALYGVAVIRILMGLLFFAVARGSRHPAILRTLGIIVIAAGVGTPALGPERARAVLRWGLSLGPHVVQIVGAFWLVLGVVILSAVGFGRRASAG